MANKLAEKENIAAFSSYLMQDSCLLPMAIFRDFKDWGIGERELVPLVRIIAPIIKQGAVSANQIAAEFEISLAEAGELAQLFVSRELLEYDPQTCSYTCRHLLTSLAESWLQQQKKQQSAKKQQQTMASAPTEERDNLRQLSMLYRSFEKDFGRNLRYTESDRLRCWLDDDKWSAEIIQEALRRAALQNKCSFAYIGSILDRWKREGLLTMSQILENDIKPNAIEPAAVNTERAPRRKKTATANKFKDVVDDDL